MFVCLFVFRYDLKEKETLANSNLAPWQRVGGTSVADQIAVVLSGADQHQLNLILEHLQVRFFVVFCC
jgi:hypothetical protein